MAVTVQKISVDRAEIDNRTGALAPALAGDWPVAVRVT